MEVLYNAAWDLLTNLRVVDDCTFDPAHTTETEDANNNAPQHNLQIDLQGHFTEKAILPTT